MSFVFYTTAKKKLQPYIGILSSEDIWFQENVFSVGK